VGLDFRQSLNEEAPIADRPGAAAIESPLGGKKLNPPEQLRGSTADGLISTTGTAVVVLGLAFSSASFLEAAPIEQTAIWTLFTCSTPITSDLLVAPARSFLMVVSLLPKASRNANGNSAASNGRSARSLTASAISTAFIFN
jgi:hypothetical protein